MELEIGLIYSVVSASVLRELLFKREEQKEMRGDEGWAWG